MTLNISVYFYPSVSELEIKNTLDFQAGEGFTVGHKKLSEYIFLRNLFPIFLGDMNSKQIPCHGGCLGLSASNSSRPFWGISTYSFNALTLRQ